MELSGKIARMSGEFTSKLQRLFLLLTFVFIGTAGAEENLLRNGSFEYEASDSESSGAVYWKMGDPDEHGDFWGGASRERWRAVKGLFSGTVRGTWAKKGNHGGWWQEVKAAPGDSYRFEGYFYNDEEWSPGEQSVKLEFWDEERKNVIGGETFALANPGPVWKLQTFRATAPEHAAWIRVVINAAKVSYRGALQIDELSLVQEAAGEQKSP